MTEQEILKTIADNFLCIRRLPFEVTSCWRYKEGDEKKLKDNQTIVQLPKWNDKKFIKEVRVVEKGGWWYVKQVTNTDSAVIFYREYDKFFAPTLEEAIQLYLKDEKEFNNQ